MSSSLCGIVERHTLGDRLQHDRLPRLGRRDDQGALAESEGTDEVERALDLGGARTRRARTLEQQRARRVHRAEVGELGAIGERGRRIAVDRRHAAVVEHDEVAATQPGQSHARVAFGGEIAVCREPERAAFGTGIEPAGD